MSEQLQNLIDEIRVDFRQSLENAEDVRSLEDLRVRFLGKKGSVTSLFKSMGNITPEERKAAGALINCVKQELEDTLKNGIDTLVQRQLQEKLSGDRIDVTLPGRGSAVGHLNPTRLVEQRVVKIFQELGFDVATGPSVENDFCNFEALNMPRWHPARDMQDSFYFSDEVLLRTHTSPVQTRTMLSHKPPIRILAPGKVFRVDEVDASHSPVFQQIEGLVVDEGITFTDFKGIIKLFTEKFFGSDIEVVFRPSYFPFTEPSAEVDVTCPICRGNGCSVCKQTGYMEIMGAGMVNPKVFDQCGIDSKKYTGFAFGLGMERVAMVLYGIPDIRYIYENDLRFTKQFGR